MWFVPQIWSDGECFIIGGGASIWKQLGVSINDISKIQSGFIPLRELGKYFFLISHKHIIGVNVAYKLGSFIDILVFGDQKFYQEHRRELNEWNGGIRVTCDDRVNDPGIKVLKRDEKMYGISSHKDKVCWNFNSGAMAINVAVHTGVKKIYLLGFDMNLQEGNSHFHSEYNHQIEPEVFAKHLVGFDQIAVDAKNMGVEIINCNPDSAITQFPKVNLNEIIMQEY